jgi:type IV secretory pathway TraG/TraD family ATPase VirD4
MTVQSRSENQGYSQSKQEIERFGVSGSNATSQQTGASLSETRRSLLTPDEIRRLDLKVLVAFLRGEEPILLQRLNYLTFSDYKGQFQSNFLRTNVCN